MPRKQTMRVCPQCGIEFYRGRGKIVECCSKSCSATLLQRRLRDGGERPARGPVRCETCGIEFTGTIGRARFCSAACSRAVAGGRSKVDRKFAAVFAKLCPNYRVPGVAETSIWRELYAAASALLPRNACDSQGPLLEAFVWGEFYGLCECVDLQWRAKP